MRPSPMGGHRWRSPRRSASAHVAAGGHPVPVPGTSSGLSMELRPDVSPGGCSAFTLAAQQCRQGRLFLSAHLTVLTVWSPRSTLLEDGGPGPQKASCSPGSRPLQGAMPFPGTSKNTPHTSARPGPAFTCPPLGQGPRLPSCRTRRSGRNLSKTPVVLAQGREVQPWERGAQGLPAKSCLWKAHWRSEMHRAGRGGGAAQCWAPCSSRCPGAGG